LETERILRNEIEVLRRNDYPDRPTIIFLHDSLGCIQLWRDFPQKLGELTKCNIFIYDRHGYGKSSPFPNRKRNNDYMEIEADILATLMDECSIDQAILFGHSDGGTIALIAGAKYPSRVTAIITEGAHIFVEEETITGIRQAINAYETTDLKAKLEKYHGDKTDAVFWAWAETWTTDEYRTWNIEGLLPSVKCPILVIQGEQDEYGTSKQVEGIIKQVSGTATKLFLPNVRHTPHKEASDLVFNKAAEFILKTLEREQNCR
jgi:pimeloyl-ACP methyl ester carboxylesterase